MKKGRTLFLKAVIVIIGLIVLGLCIFLLPEGIRTELERGDFDYGFLILGLYITAIPFYIALFQAFRLLNLIDTNTAFSELGVNALKKIKYCAVTISGAFILELPYIFYLGDKDDAPGVVAMALVIIFASAVIATFAAVLQKLLQHVIEIKSENELTV